MPTSDPPPARPAGRPLSARLAADRWLVLVLIVLATLPFWPSIDGDFVYDDRHQIVGNHLIQDNQYLPRALTSDVWAFKGEREAAWSNYWRPTFVLWLALQHRLFGLESTVGWHLSSIGLHALVCLLAFAVLRRQKIDRSIAAAICGLFAVHPVHVESVAWISGSPDLLAAAAMLGTLLLVPRGRAEHRAGRWTASLGLAVVALGSKEIAVVLPILVGLLVWHSNRSSGKGLSRAWRTAWPFAVLATLFLLARWRVLGTVELDTPWSLGWLGMAANVPALLIFYLRQSLLPIVLGPSYPLRAIETAAIGWSNFWLPLLALLLVAGLVLALARHRPVLWTSCAILGLPLLPALNIDAFIGEQIVHDRYLYLPLLGLLTILWVGLAAAFARIGKKKRELLTLGLAMVLGLPLAWQTSRYSRAWTSELALWSRAVEVDPSSAFNHTEHGNALLAAGRLEEAKLAFDRALAIEPVTVAYLNRADLATRQGRFSDAEADLELVRRYLPQDSRIYSRLATIQLSTGRIAEARETLLEGRRQAPERWCALTADLAVVFYQSGDKAAALAELEAGRQRLDREPSAGCLRGLLRLAMLYRETGRPELAAAALEELEARTSGQRSPALKVLHQQARQALGRAS